ncbi:MAG: DNA repair protein RecO [Kiritimatiellia bacterium]
MSEPQISKDEGLVLRWFPVTDSSRVVVWFTARHGKVSTLIKGAQRPKSWMLGQFDLFYTCEVLFYTRANDDLHLIRECSAIHRRSAFRTNWRACAGASFVADMLYRISPPLASATRIYTLASRTLDLLNSTPENPSLLFWFELQVYRDLGLSPEFKHPGGTSLVFDYQAGSIRQTDPGTRGACHPVTAGTLSCLTRLQESEQPEKLSRLKLQPAQIQEITGHLDRFSRWHLEQPFPSRSHAVELMGRV